MILLIVFLSVMSHYPCRDVRHFVETRIDYHFLAQGKTNYRNCRNDGSAALPNPLKRGLFIVRCHSAVCGKQPQIPARAAAETPMTSDAGRAFPRLPWTKFRTKLGRTAPSIEAASDSSLQKAMPFGAKPYAFRDKTLCLLRQNPMPFEAEPYTFRGKTLCLCRRNRDCSPTRRYLAGFHLP